MKLWKSQPKRGELQGPRQAWRISHLMLDRKMLQWRKGGRLGRFQSMKLQMDSHSTSDCNVFGRRQMRSHIPRCCRLKCDQIIWLQASRPPSGGGPQFLLLVRVQEAIFWEELEGSMVESKVSLEWCPPSTSNVLPLSSVLGDMIVSGFWDCKYFQRCPNYSLFLVENTVSNELLSV